MATIDVFPGRTLVMTTGPEGHAYAEVAQRFRLRAIEARARAANNDQDLAALSGELDALDVRIAKAWIPRGFSAIAHELKLHLAYVRNFLDAVNSDVRR